MSDREHAYFGDLHNHCNMSYAHGDLEDAIANARQRLDFCSVTGHAHWPDMPEASERTQHIVDFHTRGFQKLKRNWEHSLDILEGASEPGRFLTFPSFEVHSSEDGDRAVVYREARGDLLYPENIAALDRALREMTDAGRPAIVHPARRPPVMVFEEPIRAVTPGQAAVAYDEAGRVLCGGWIDRRLPMNPHQSPP